MMFDIAITTDMTARALQARDEKRGREETFVTDRPSRAFEETPFLVYRDHVPSERRNGSLTPTGAELGRLGESTKGTMNAPSKTASKEDAVDRVPFVSHACSGEQGDCPQARCVPSTA